MPVKAAPLSGLSINHVRKVLESLFIQDSRKSGRLLNDNQQSVTLHLFGLPPIYIT